MYRHGMVAASIVTSMAADIKTGRLTPEDMAKELSKQCFCGVFNPVLGAELLKAMAAR